MSEKYILKDGRAVPCDDLNEWATWFQTDANRILRKTTVGDKTVSTVFLGLDHAFNGGPPVLWETMVFPDEDMQRYTSEADAIKGHEEIVIALLAAENKQKKGNMSKDRKLGQLNTVEKRGFKDAFHVAAILVGSDHPLKAGEKVRFEDHDYDWVRPLEPGETQHHAIVDPFLESGYPGDDKDNLFWIILVPGASNKVSHNFEVTVDKFEGQWSCKDCV